MESEVYMKNTSLKAFSNNQCKIADLTFKMSEITVTNRFVVTGVSIKKKYVDGKPTDEVEGINYTLTDPETFTQIRVKALTTTPVITQEELDASETPIFIEIPLDKTLLKPFKIEYGTVSLSVTTPSVRLAENDDLVDIEAF